MSYWSTSTGEAVNTGETSYETEGGNFAPIPEGSNVLAICEKAAWRTVKDRDEKYVELKWSILQPESVKNRKIFQKLWVGDLDPNERDKEKATKKRDRQLLMFATIDANAGGRLSKSNEMPTDNDLSVALENKMMVLGLGVWKTKSDSGEDMSGNWVRKIEPKSHPVNVPDTKPTVYASSSSSSYTTDDDIPF